MQPAHPDDNSVCIGGYDTKEGVIQFFSRFFSRTFRNHTLDSVGFS